MSSRAFSTPALLTRSLQLTKLTDPSEFWIFWPMMNSAFFEPSVGPVAAICEPEIIIRTML